MRCVSKGETRPSYQPFSEFTNLVGKLDKEAQYFNNVSAVL